MFKAESAIRGKNNANAKENCEYCSCILLFTGPPVQFMNFGEIPYAYAEDGTSAVDIRYDNFSDTENLQLKGENIITNNAIRFESDEEAEESVFTKDKLTLAEDSSFSTAFSFIYTSPSTPVDGTKGGFIFMLKQAGESDEAGGLDDGGASPGLSIDFLTEYFKSGIVARSV
mgnify:CR=1 FL=1